MHRIHTTEAFVLSSTPLGEGSSFVRFYTRELGLLSAWVQGTRILKSKLRSHVQPFSYSRLSLVRGKDMWRVTGAEGIEPLVDPLGDPERFRFVAKIFVLLSRLVAGEESDPELFDSVKSGVLGNGVKDLSMVELLLVLRILSRLGYLPDDSRISPFLEYDFGDAAVEEALRPHKSHAIGLVNAALRASQL